MWVLYTFLVAIIICLHIMIYILIKAGLKESKRPLPPSMRRRQAVQMRAWTATEPGLELYISS